jgi:hypothetical protein
MDDEDLRIRLKSIEEVARFNLVRDEEFRDEVRKDLAQVREEIQQQEIRRLRWGISALGGVLAVIGIFAWETIRDAVQAVIQVGDKHK